MCAQGSRVEKLTFVNTRQVRGNRRCSLLRQPEPRALAVTDRKSKNLMTDLKAMPESLAIQSNVGEKMPINS
jgi:hypothetical protein